MRIESVLKDKATIVLVSQAWDEVLIRYDEPKVPGRPYATLKLPIYHSWKFI
jgi:hypothetical protein